MALDTNIALGIKPIEQPNMLAQMGQMMQMRQMQQGFESENALRDFYAQGGDISTDEGKRRLMSKVGLKGAEIIDRQSQTRSRDVGTLGKEYENARVGLTNVNDEAGYYNWVQSSFNNPAIAAHLNQMGITPEKALANARATVAKEGLSTAIAKSSMGISEFVKQDLQLKNATKNAQIATGPAYARLNYDIANPTQHFFTGPDGTLMVAPQKGAGGARPVPMAGGSTVAPAPPITIGSGSAPAGAGSSIMINPSAVNNLAPINQNSLITQPQPTPAPAAPTFAQVRATPVTKDIVDPTDPTGRRMITVEVNTYKAGTGLGADGNAPPPRGVLGVASSPIPPNYMRDPNNPQGVIPVPGSAADPNAVVPPNYRKTADGKGLEPIPGGPADPKVIAAQNTVKLSTKDREAREAKYPQATSALKGFEAKTKQFESVINELIENKKGLDEITGFFAGRTDVSAMSDAGRRALSLFNTITAKGGFSELQAMRNASPTGGALGNVSNQEGQQLINSFGALSRTQSGDDLRKSLVTAKSDLQNLQQRMREAYDLTYEYKTQATGGFTYLGKE